MSEARVTKVYKKGQQGYNDPIPFGLTGDYVSMHSGINLERQLKIGALKETFMIKDSNTDQMKFYEIYLDGMQEYDSSHYDDRKNKCYIVESVIGNEAFTQYLTTKREQNKIVTNEGKYLVLLGKVREENNLFATVTLYLGAVKNANQSFISLNPAPQKICEVTFEEDNGSSIVTRTDEYYGVPIAVKRIETFKTQGALRRVKEVYSA